MTNPQDPQQGWGDQPDWQNPAGAGQPPYGGGYQQPPPGSPQYPGYPQPAWPGPIAPAIQTYLVPAILVTLLCCWPTGIAAIVFAAQASSKRNAGDYVGAVAASKKALTWTIVSLVVGVILIVIVIAVAASHSSNSSV
jgi:hypothetical protein